MLKYCVNNSMIGNYYPFFLSNNNLSDSYYLYRIFSPSLSDNLIPYLSLEKISEKTKLQQQSGGSEVLSEFTGLNVNGVEFLTSILKKENLHVNIKENKDKFPLVEMISNNSLQKSLIVNLRDSLRWKCYRFTNNKYVDVLWTPTKFAVFKIKEDKEDKNSLRLELTGVYNNMDVNLSNPLNVDTTKLLEITKEKFTGKSKASDLNRLLKKLDWNSFDRKELKEIK